MRRECPKWSTSTSVSSIFGQVKLVCEKGIQVLAISCVLNMCIGANKGTSGECIPYVKVWKIPVKLLMEKMRCTNNWIWKPFQAWMESFTCPESLVTQLRVVK